MLLLVTIGLVLVGAISLVIGFVSSSLAPIYLSIACSIVAGGVLVVFSRMSRRQAPAAAGAGGPAPLGEPAPMTEEVVGAATQTSAPVVPDLPFPIEDYDDLKVNQIVPLLPELDLDELDMVREREVAGRNRATIVKKIDELIEELEAQAEAAVGAAPVPATATAEEPTAAVPAVSGAGLPIEDYDSLSVNQILPLLPELDDDELEAVAEYEEKNKNRAQIVKRIDQIFETGEVAGAAAEKLGVTPTAPAKKTAAKKTAAKKSAAKKAAAPAKKTTAKKSAAKKAAAPAKKSAAKRAAAPAKKTAAKKAAAKKAAAPAKKTAAKKTAAKKTAAKKR